MQEQFSEFRGEIPPVRVGMARPHWSVMVPTYNNSSFLGDTLRSILSQCLGPEEMQIEVVDDQSDDDVATIVREIGRGRVSYFRQERRVGHIANFHTCILRSTGRLIHLLHGDDVVLPGFYEALNQGFETEPDLGAAFCRHIFVDESGNELSVAPIERTSAGLIHDAVCHLAGEQRIMTPAIAVRREVYENLGGFDRRLQCSEDWEMWVRIAAKYPIWYEPRPLAIYRMHMNSNTGRHQRSGRDISYTREAIEIFRSYLPPDRADEIVRTARMAYANSALDSAQRFLDFSDYKGFFAQLKEALILTRSRRVLKRAARLLFQYGRRRART